MSRICFLVLMLASTPACRCCEEVSYGRSSLDPHPIDSDNDLLTDFEEEVFTETDPHKTDTDGDGLPDGWEWFSGLDPCECFARFAEVLRRLADDYETLAHSKAEVRNRDWRKRVRGVENRLSRSQSGSWTYRLRGRNRYKPSEACTSRECGEKWRI